MDRKLAAKIRRLLSQGGYHATAHAVEEMEEDAVFDSDIVAAAETMDALKIQRDRRGPKYRFEGRSGDRRIGVVCRFTPRKRPRIITVYEIDES